MKRRLLFAATFLLAACAVSGAEVPQNAQDITPLLIGADVPEVSLRTPSGEAVSLKQLITQQPSVIIFYRGGWCPYCSRHLAQLQDAESSLKQMGFQILAISPDRPAKLQETIGKETLSYQLLSDSSMAASRAFGIAFRLDDATFKKYKESYGIDIEADSGEMHHQLPVPAVFIVGTDGKIAFSYVNPNYKVRLTSDVLLAAAKSVKESL